MLCGVGSALFGKLEWEEAAVWSDLVWYGLVYLIASCKAALVLTVYCSTRDVTLSHPPLANFEGTVDGFLASREGALIVQTQSDASYEKHLDMFPKAGVFCRACPPIVWEKTKKKRL